MIAAPEDLTGPEWAEYDSAAAWCAKRGIRGAHGDPLPDGLSARVAAEISEHSEAFAERVRGFAYAAAMERAESVAVPFVDVQVEHGPGGPLRASRAVRVY